MWSFHKTEVAGRVGMRIKTKQETDKIPQERQKQSKMQGKMQNKNPDWRQEEGKKKAYIEVGSKTRGKRKGKKVRQEYNLRGRN